MTVHPTSAAQSIEQGSVTLPGITEPLDFTAAFWAYA
jgi:hypothetical protein